MSRLVKQADKYYNAREIAEKNHRLMEDKKDDKCTFFEWNGYKIFDPFKDETGDKDVDPVEYYGKAYEQSDFNK
jgi:hypothetical protein